MNKYARKFGDNCITCKIVKSPTGKIQAELHPTPNISIPWHTVHVDITGKLSGKSDLKEYIIVQIDSFTKFVYLYHTVKLDTDSCIKALRSSISLFGAPSRVITDQGRYFTSSKFSEFCSSRNIRLHLISTGSSRANGQVERVMSTLKNLLTAVECREKSWQDSLGDVQLVLNYTVNRITEAVETESDIDLSGVRTRACRNMESNASYDKERFVKTKAVVKRHCVGDYVLLWNEERHQTKLDPKFRGPFVVAEVLDEDRYTLKSFRGNRSFKYCHENIRKIPEGYIPSEFDIDRVQDDSSKNVSEIV